MRMACIYIYHKANILERKNQDRLDIGQGLFFLRVDRTTRTFLYFSEFQSGQLTDSLRRRANSRNVSYRISLRWAFHIINPVR